jgi:hypothetical protein
MDSLRVATNNRTCNVHNTFALGADLAVYEKNGKSFTIYLQQGAEIALTDGQTKVSFSFVSDQDIKRRNADNQEIIAVRAGELYYVRDGQGNLVAGTDQPTQKPIYGEVDGQRQIVGYEEIPSDDAQVTTNAIFVSAGKDKILGLSGSDLLGGFGGNEEIDGGSGADMIGGGTGSDNIKGGDGDDYISSSANVMKSNQQYGKDDAWQNYGLPQGKEAIRTQALWGTHVDTESDGGKVTIWHGITETDTSTTDGDVIDAGAGDDSTTLVTTNSIAHRADNTTAKCQKRLKNIRKATQKAQGCKKSKPNRPITGIEPAQSAIEFAVTSSATHHASEVRHA